MSAARPPPGYIRPKRLPTGKLIAPHQQPTKATIMDKYTRDGRAALAFTKGFPPDVAGALNMMIDLMALHHDDQGIPADPETYVVGMLGLTSSRKWTAVIEPALLGAKRLRKVKRDGIMVYRFPDEFMPGGARALFMPRHTTATEIRAEMNATTARIMSQHVNVPDLETGEGGEPTKPSIADIIAETGKKMQAGLDEIAPPPMPLPARHARNAGRAG